MQDIPIEIWELVIDHFRFEHPMLKMLALISKGCTRRARFYLFRTIILRNDCQYQRLLPILENNLDACGAVRRLFLDGSNSAAEVLDADDMPTTYEFWVDSALQRLQTMLKHVEAFRISYPLDRYLPAHHLQPVFPRLNELVLAECLFLDIEDLVHIIRMHSNLRSLTMSGVRVDNLYQITGNCPPLSCLRYLEVDCSAAAVVMLTRNILDLSGPLSNVSVLRLDNATQNEEFAVAVLSALSSSLTHVRIHISRFGYRLYNSRILQEITHLSSLMIDMSVHAREFLYSFASHIRSLSFSTLIVRHRFLTGPRTMQNETWLMLGETLRAPFFAELRKFQWVVQLGVNTQEIEDTVRAKLNVPELNSAICCVNERDFIWERPLLLKY